MLSGNMILIRKNFCQTYLFLIRKIIARQACFIDNENALME